MKRPPLLVPGRPDDEMAAQFPCPFCTGTAYFGVLGLIAEATGQTSPIEGIGVAHTKPSCETFKSLSAEGFRDACRARMKN